MDRLQIVFARTSEANTPQRARPEREEDESIQRLAKESGAAHPKTNLDDTWVRLQQTLLHALFRCVVVGTQKQINLSTKISDILNH